MAVIIILCILIVLLLLITLFLYRSLNRLKQTIQTTTQEALFYETLFNAIPIALFYKDGSTEGGNKAFNHAFGTYKKGFFEQALTLPKNAEQNVTLTYDNHIQKQSLILCAPLLDAHNNILGITGAIWDINSWNKSKENLLIQKQRLELAIEGTQDGVFDWDMQKDIFFYSSRWKHIMGYDPHDTPTSLASWLNLVHPKDMALVNEVLARYLDGHTNALFVEHRIRDTQPTVWIAARAKVVFGQNNTPIRMVGTIRDISARKINEDKLRIYKDMFVSFVEHLPVLAYIKDTQGNFIYINYFFKKYIGFQMWEHKNAYTLFDHDTADKMSECDRLSLLEGKIEHTLNISTEEGDAMPIHLYTFIVDTEEGQKLLCGMGINKSFKE
ncbi:MAG: PAS domain-containing protein [Sulfurospirillaceae bacterium]|nr:PAS domain-containing protein [Sulfurospirillaceae bacterium]